MKLSSRIRELKPESGIAQHQLVRQEEDILDVEYDSEYEEDPEKRKMYLEIDYPYLNLFTCDEENEEFVIDYSITLIESKDENMLYLPILFLNHIRVMAALGYTLIEKEGFTAGKEYERYKKWKTTREYWRLKSPGWGEIEKIDIVTGNQKELQDAKNEEPPLCPNCGAEMTLRYAKRGPTAGTKFWGCTKFPFCRGTYPYTSPNLEET